MDMQHRPAANAATVSMDIGPFLREGTEELLNTGLFSDFTIICELNEYRVHKNVLFVHGGKFRELVERAHEAGKDTLHVKQEAPAIFEAVLQYLYRLDFDSPTLSEGAQFQFTALVYLMANKYDVQGLPELALAKCEQACAPEKDLGSFIRNMQLAQQVKDSGDPSLWEVVYRVAEARFDLLEAQGNNGSLFDHEEECLARLLAEIRGSKNPLHQQNSSDSDDGGVGIDENICPATSKRTPIVEAERTTKFVPPHLRPRLGEINQNVAGQGQLDATATTFKPTAAQSTQKVEAKMKSEKAQGKLPQVQDNVPAAHAATASKNHWNDDPQVADRWPVVEGDNYAFTNSNNDHSSNGWSNGWSQPREPEPTFAGTGRRLDAAVVDPIARERQNRSIRENFIASKEAEGKAKQPSKKFVLRFGKGD
ncbi:unnamed protein product [Zymoseptoria tritici ST99CH_1A5]|uniref:BTB domain-containing protein n=1 Tax=Zymoseptoria tritici ST99CH_1A5 TaxID=1276529 RepID=A0A1Y6LFG7_ZYMTR|nr:unnamed protein product [Zymoseptoria tritici ST99CH_1A5]